MASVDYSTMQQMVADLYSGPSWKHKVYNVFTKQRVCAIYFDSLKRGKFDKNRKKEEAAIAKENKNYIQLSIFDWMKNK